LESITLTRAATFGDGSSNLVGTWSVLGRCGFFCANKYKEKATCGGSFSLGALWL
jgi:hypothetical protein